MRHVVPALFLLLLVSAAPAAAGDWPPARNLDWQYARYLQRLERQDYGAVIAAVEHQRQSTNLRILREYQGWAPGPFLVPRSAAPVPPGAGVPARPR
jgi:hypothetical protein